MTRYERIARLEFTLTLRDQSRRRRNILVSAGLVLLSAVAALAAFHWPSLGG